MSNAPKPEAPQNAAHDRRGIECPRCGCRHFRVIYTRPRNYAIVRLRECRYCGRRVMTREQTASGGQQVPHM